MDKLQTIVTAFGEIKKLPTKKEDHLDDPLIQQMKSMHKQELVKVGGRYITVETMELFNYIDPQLVTNILNKESDTRTRKELILLEKAFMNNNFFKEIKPKVNPENYRKILQVMNVKSYQRSDVVIKYGTKGKNFFIITEGEVYVLIPNQSTIKNNNPQSQTQYTKKPVNNMVSRKSSHYNQSPNKNSTFFSSTVTDMGENIMDKSYFKPKSDLAQALQKEHQQIRQEKQQILLLENEAKNQEAPLLFSKNPQKEHIKIKQQNQQQIQQKINQSQVDFQQAVQKKQLDIISKEYQQKMNFSQKNKKSDLPTPINPIDRMQSCSSLKLPEQIEELHDVYELEEKTLQDDEFRQNQILQNVKEVQKNPIKIKTQEEIQQEEIENQHPGFVIVNVLKPGDCFGELALKYERERTATVVCKSNCKLLILNKYDYNMHIGGQHRQEQDIKQNFIQNIPVFQGALLETYTGIMYEMKQKTFSARDFIYQENQPTDNIYFLISGEVEVQKKTPKSDKKFKQDFLPLQRKFSNQMFGEIEIMQRMSKRYTSIVCVSPKVSVYYIDQRTFFLNLGSKSVFNKLQTHANQTYQFIKKEYQCSLQTVYFDKQTLQKQDIKSNKDAKGLLTDLQKDKLIVIKDSDLNRKQENQVILYHNIKRLNNKLLSVKDELSYYNKKLLSKHITSANKLAYVPGQNEKNDEKMSKIKNYYRSCQSEQKLPQIKTDQPYYVVKDTQEIKELMDQKKTEQISRKPVRQRVGHTLLRRHFAKQNFANLGSINDVMDMDFQFLKQYKDSNYSKFEDLRTYQSHLLSTTTLLTEESDQNQSLTKDDLLKKKERLVDLVNSKDFLTVPKFQKTDRYHNTTSSKSQTLSEEQQPISSYRSFDVNSVILSPSTFSTPIFPKETFNFKKKASKPAINLEIQTDKENLDSNNTPQDTIYTRYAKSVKNNFRKSQIFVNKDRNLVKNNPIHQFQCDGSVSDKKLLEYSQKKVPTINIGFAQRQMQRSYKTSPKNAYQLDNRSLRILKTEND